MKMSDVLVLWLVSILSLSVSGFYLNTAEGGVCQRVAKRVATLEKAAVLLTAPSRITGKWASETCETRPGPEYLLRSYTFHTNSSFKLVQHYYEDPSCSSPSYTVVAHGRLGTPGKYSLSRVVVIPHTPEVSQQLAAKIESTCPGTVRKRSKRMKEYVIFNQPDTTSYKKPFTTLTTSDGSPMATYGGGSKKSRIPHAQCLHALTLTFNELLRYKVQIKPGIEENLDLSHYRLELLLGDIHSRLEGRASYTPTAYQVPLLKISTTVAHTLEMERNINLNTDSLVNLERQGVKEIFKQKSYVGHFDVGKVGELDSIISSTDKEDPPTEIDREVFHYCHVCSAIAKATEKSPPFLIKKVFLPLSLSGEWVSVRCENRPNGLYLTRHFKFYPGDSTWIVEYKFYSDDICGVSSFSVTEAGHYQTSRSNQHSRGTDVDFQVERASLTVFDSRMLDNLEQDPDCGLGPWKLGVPREMSSTHGCTMLDLVVPRVEYETLKMESDFNGYSLLFMGQVETDTRRRGSNERPTAFQPPLIQCQNLPSHSESLREILSSPLYSDDVYNQYDPRVLAMEDSGAMSLTMNLYILGYSILTLILLRSCMK